MENVRHCCHPLRIKVRRLPSTLITPGWYSTDKQGDPSLKSKRYQFLHWHRLQEGNTMPEWCMPGLQKEVDGWYLEKNSALRRCSLVWFSAHSRSVKGLEGQLQNRTWHTFPGPHAFWETYSLMAARLHLLPDKLPLKSKKAMMTSANTD